MNFLTPAECEKWCARHRIRILHGPREIETRDDWPSEAYDFPIEAERKLLITKTAFGSFGEADECLVWMMGWDVFPSCSHRPLFETFRRAFGERRPIIEAPGALIGGDEFNEGISMMFLAFVFFWDGYAASSSGDTFFVSHDEYFEYSSREKARVQRFTETIKSFKWNTGS